MKISTWVIACLAIVLCGCAKQEAPPVSAPAETASEAPTPDESAGAVSEAPPYDAAPADAAAPAESPPSEPAAAAPAEAPRAEQPVTAAAPPPRPAPPWSGAPGARPPPGDRSPAGEAAGGRPEAAKPSPYAVVRSYFATNRNRIEGAGTKVTFGGGRGRLSYGYCDVSIPRYHQVGQLESPSIWRLEFREDPAKHVMVMSVKTQTKDAYFAELAAAIASSRNRNSFVFVHGYNVSFDDAARRTAQISYDLGFGGVPVFFSWPSQASVAAYTVDENNVLWAETGLRTFLEDYLTRSRTSQVTLVAHSMGNRGLAGAMTALLQKNPSLASKISEIILAAPDIDADVFKDQIAPALIAAQRPITLYASSKDYALLASKDVHGYARAGDAGPGLVIIKGIETVDATLVDTSLLGHSYIGDSRSVISDMTALVLLGTRAEKRATLKFVDGSGGRYWTFKP